MLLTPGVLAAQRRAAGEYEVKAAYLYNFAKFVEWPAAAFESERSPLVFCVVGQDPFGDSLQAVLGNEKIGQRELMVLKARSIDDPEVCHVLFASRSERARFDQVLAPVRDAGVLTVGDADGFLEAGGLVELTLDGERVRFEINGPAAERSPLKISSRLLRLARIVAPGPPGR